MRKIDTKTRKKYRIRNKLKKISSNDRFRLTVSRSSKNISAQIIDVVKKITLVSASSSKKEIRSLNKTKSEMSIMVAELIATKAKEKNINKIYFDRGIYKFHGRVKKLADALRKNGMEF